MCSNHVKSLISDVSNILSSSRKERLIYVGISVENIIEPTVSGCQWTRFFLMTRLFEWLKLNCVFQQAVEEEQKPDIVKEKKEVKRSKSWGRRSTRAKKSISYR